MRAKIVIIVSVITALSGIVAVIYLAHKPIMKIIGVDLPNGKGAIHGTTFRGPQPNSLDGTLRLCWTGKDNITKCFQQTNIPVDPSLELKWNSELLQVWKSKRKLMEFRLGEDRLICVSGGQHLEEDPYKK